MTKKTEVAQEGKKDVAVFDIAMMEQDAGAGMDNMGTEDLALPFLKILSGNDAVLDDEYQRRFIQWAPRGSGSGAPMAIYEPGQERPKTERSSEDNKEYVVDGEGDYIEETHQHFVILINDDGSHETALIAMKSTQLKKSRKWNSMMASRSMNGKNGPFTPPRFSHIYHLKTIPEENSKGSWHGWEMSCEGVIEDGALYTRAKGFAESITAGDVVVKHTEDEDSEQPSAF